MMKTNTPSTQHFDSYPAFFRIHVHQLIAWGHAEAKPKIKTDDEEDITGLIYGAIKDVLRSGRQRWLSNYSVHNEDPISDGKRTGRDRRQIDLIIEWTTQVRRPEYIFEAKPLNYAKRYQRANNYLGREGLRRFIQKCEYADYTANSPEVAMIGYVLSDKPAQWRERLKTAIDDKQTELRLIPPQRDVQIIPDFPLEWISEHHRANVSRQIAIYHILLDCCV
jgi:hypothetical protein